MDKKRSLIILFSLALLILITICILSQIKIQGTGQMTSPLQQTESKPTFINIIINKIKEIFIIGRINQRGIEKPDEISNQLINKGNITTIRDYLENSELTEYEKYAVNEIISNLQDNEINLKQGQVAIRESTEGKLVASQISIKNELPLEWVNNCDVGAAPGGSGINIYHYNRTWELIVTIPYFF